MQLDMVRWFGVLGAELCLVVLWTSIEDYACITSHAPITPAAHFIFAVKLVVVYSIVVCWALLLQFFGAAQIHHTRRPTEFCFHGYVQVKAIAILLCATILATEHRQHHGVRQCKVFWLLRILMAIIVAVLWLNSAWLSCGLLNEDFGCVASHAQRTAATYFTGVVKSDVVHIAIVRWAFLLQSFGAAQIANISR